MSGAGPITVGVTPAEQLESRPRLFAALEAALPVRFEGGRRMLSAGSTPCSCLAAGIRRR